MQIVIGCWWLATASCIKLLSKTRCWVLQDIWSVSYISKWKFSHGHFQLRENIIIAVIMTLNGVYHFSNSRGENMTRPTCAHLSWPVDSIVRIYLLKRQDLFLTRLLWTVSEANWVVFVLFSYFTEPFLMHFVLIHFV